MTSIKFSHGSHTGTPSGFLGTPNFTNMMCTVHHPQKKISTALGLLGRLCSAHQSAASDLCTHTVKILKFGTPQTIAIIVLKIKKFDVTLH